VNGNKGHARINATEREEILQAYLNKPEDGVRLAVRLGLSQNYPFKLAHERGLLPKWAEVNR
jgi:hypothetical protein